jgi:SAM-dependent methyltransferase
MKEKYGEYWGSVSADWGVDRQTLWRMHSDMLNNALLERWLPAERVESVLKTDLFDEMSSDGLYPFLARRSRSFVGIDVSAATASLARSRHGGIRAVAADVRQLPFPEGAFDLVVSNSTLDHFETRGEIALSLSELYRVLRPGGELIITMDNPANPVIALRNALPFRLLNRLGLTPYYVGATCGEGTLRRLLEKAGFKVAATDTLLHSPRVIVVAIARLMERHAPPGAQSRFLRLLPAFERLGRLPTRLITAHFTAARAVK